MRSSLRTRLIRTIVAVTRQNGGAAVKLDTHEFLPAMDIWSFPKYPGKTVILSPDYDLEAGLSDFIARNEQLLRESDCWLGTWIHPETQEFYLDIATGCKDLQDAMRLALQASEQEGRRVVALYNSERKETVYL